MLSKPVAVLIQYGANRDGGRSGSGTLGTYRQSGYGGAACISINLHQNSEEPASLMLYERWTDKESYLGEHMRTSAHSQFLSRRPAGSWLGRRRFPSGSC
jgi:Antibiotic biosynthesis monooxygenase